MQKLKAIIEKFKEIYKNEAAIMVSVDNILPSIFGELLFDFIESNFLYKTKVNIFFLKASLKSWIGITRMIKNC